MRAGCRPRRQGRASSAGRVAVADQARNAPEAESTCDRARRRVPRRATRPRCPATTGDPVARVLVVGDAARVRDPGLGRRAADAVVGATGRRGCRPGAARDRAAATRSRGRAGWGAGGAWWWGPWKRCRPGARPALAPIHRSSCMDRRRGPGSEPRPRPRADAESADPVKPACGPADRPRRTAR